MSLIASRPPGAAPAADLCSADLPPAIRKVNLTAHETHNQPIHASLTAMDLSRIRMERERVQMEEARKRDQQRMYQQAQAAAMVQQQQQAAGRGGMPPQMPMNIQGVRDRA